MANKSDENNNKAAEVIQTFLSGMPSSNPYNFVRWEPKGKANKSDGNKAAAEAVKNFLADLPSTHSDNFERWEPGQTVSFKGKQYVSTKESTVQSQAGPGTEISASSDESDEAYFLYIRPVQ